MDKISCSRPRSPFSRARNCAACLKPPCVLTSSLDLGGILHYWLLEVTKSITIKLLMQPTGKQVETWEETIERVSWEVILKVEPGPNQFQSASAHATHRTCNLFVNQVLLRARIVVTVTCHSRPINASRRPYRLIMMVFISTAAMYRKR